MAMEAAASGAASPLHLQVHGARGSTPVSGAAFLRHGGSTSCYSVQLADGHHVIIDCGTGLGRIQASLTAGADFDATILLTHFHWDHIQGLPTFAPLHEASARLHIVAMPPDGISIEEAIDRVVRPPWFPVSFREAPARVTYEAPGEGPIRIGPLEVTTARLRHPSGVTAFRLAHGERSVVIATDTEAGDPESDAALANLARGASVLVHDAQYLPDEYVTLRQGWGHSTWEHATAAAALASVGRLVLTSHDPSRSDGDIDRIVAAAREQFPATEAAFEGQLIEL